MRETAPPLPRVKRSGWIPGERSRSAPPGFSRTRLPPGRCGACASGRVSPGRSRRIDRASAGTGSSAWKAEKRRFPERWQKKPGRSPISPAGLFVQSQACSGGGIGAISRSPVVHAGSRDFGGDGRRTLRLFAAGSACRLKCRAFFPRVAVAFPASCLLRWSSLLPRGGRTDSPSGGPLPGPGIRFGSAVPPSGEEPRRRGFFPAGHSRPASGRRVRAGRTACRHHRRLSSRREAEFLPAPETGMDMGWC